HPALSLSPTRRSSDLPFDQEAVELATALLLAKLPTITAYAFRHLRGEEMIGPDQSLGYLPDFLRMSFANGGSHEVDPELVSALNLLLILQIGRASCRERV